MNLLQNTCLKYEVSKWLSHKMYIYFTYTIVYLLQERNKRQNIQMIYTK